MRDVTVIDFSVPCPTPGCRGRITEGTVCGVCGDSDFKRTQAQWAARAEDLRLRTMAEREALTDSAYDHEHGELVPV